MGRPRVLRPQLRRDSLGGDTMTARELARLRKREALRFMAFGALAATLYTAFTTPWGQVSTSTIAPVVVQWLLRIAWWIPTAAVLGILTAGVVYRQQQMGR